MVGVAFSVFLAGATDADLYIRIQKSYDTKSGVWDMATRKADEAIADYLAGDSTGLSAQLFTQREIAHMQDVYNLFADMRLIRAVVLPLGVILLFAAVFKSRNWTRLMPLGGTIATVLFLVPFLVVGTWGAIDFHGAFRMMHEFLFDNRLWLLNPETDLLIQILPQEFFERIAVVLVSRCVLSALILPLLLITGPLFYRKIDAKVIV